MEKATIFVELLIPIAIGTGSAIGIFGSRIHLVRQLTDSECSHKLQDANSLGS